MTSDGVRTVTTLIRNARVLTLCPLDDPGIGAPLTHHAMRDLGVIDSANVLLQNGLVSSIGPSDDQRYPHAPLRTIDACGRVLMPGFVDCHTHLCWAGKRLDEWQQKLAGTSYLDILTSGGGIMSTVRAVRSATEEELVELLVQRLHGVLRHGTTTIEIKSGYGLDTETELKMLRALARADECWPGTIVPTACIGHALDPAIDRTTFIKRTIHETLPEVTRQFPGIAIDAYCENGALSLDECCTLFDAARHAGHPCRVHADQFNSLGMTQAAIARNFVSVDHLEATSESDLASLARSDTFGVMLPIAGLHTDDRYGNGRAFIDGGGTLAIATNCNPGSAPSISIPLAIALAVRKNKLTSGEAITACTRNPASLLKLLDRGIVRPGARADLVLLSTDDERELAHTLGGNPVSCVLCEGRVV